MNTPKYLPLLLILAISITCSTQSSELTLPPYPQKLWLINEPNCLTLCFRNEEAKTLPLGPKLYQDFDSNRSCYIMNEKVNLLESPNIVQPVLKTPNSKQYTYLLQQYIQKTWTHNLLQHLLPLLSQNTLSLTDLAPWQIELTLSPSLSSSLSPLPSPLNKSIGTLYKRVGGKGLHQKVDYRIVLKGSDVDINQEQCQVVFEERVTQEYYVDVDQLQSKQFKVELPSPQTFIDIEAPAYKARQYIYRLTVPWSKFKARGNQYVLQVPIHFRYPAPYFLQEKYNTRPVNSKGELQPIDYISVSVAPTHDARIVCESHPQNYTVQGDYLQDIGAAAVPVGDGELRSSVSFITLGLEAACAIIIVKKLKK